MSKDIVKTKSKTDLIDQQAEKIKIEFTADEEIVALIQSNTRNTKSARSVNNIYKLMAMIAGGTSMKTACKLTGIGRTTLNKWRNKDWYNRGIELIRTQLDQQLDGKMTHVLNVGLSKLYERLEQGDIVLQRNGEAIHKPVNAKDAAIISSILFDKRNLLRNKPTSISSNTSTDERLDQLAERFRDIAQNNTIYEYDDIVDAEIVIEDIQEVDNVKRQQTQTNEQVHNSGTVQQKLEQSVQVNKQKQKSNEDTKGQAEKCFTFA